jgi:DNA-binding MarR family transcriptional regulator
MDNVKRLRSTKRGPHATPCLCAALRQATRAVTRVYDAELRKTGLKTAQHSLLRLHARSGELRQGDLGALAALDETTLTRSLRPLEKTGWITIRAGADRRERLVAITQAGQK